MGNLLGKAIAIASEAFKDKVDKAGEPYILHCLRVMNAVKHLGENAMMVAVLHDLLEDCDDWTHQRLQDEGFPPGVINRVVILTKTDEMDYDAYIRALSIDNLCVEIKKADLKDNSDITRLKGLRKKDFERMEKYHRAFVYLSN